MKSEECREGSECMMYKEGGNRGVEKVCKCSEGFVEIDFSCSGKWNYSLVLTYLR